jgi:hypothetical protein
VCPLRNYSQQAGCQLFLRRFHDNEMLKLSNTAAAELRPALKNESKKPCKIYPLHLFYGHYATGRKVAGSIPDVIGFFSLPNPSNRTMALGSTQPLTKTSTRNLSGDKGRPQRVMADNLSASSVSRLSRTAMANWRPAGRIRPAA